MSVWRHPNTGGRERFLICLEDAQGLNGVSFVMATAIFLLGLLHQKGKINVSYRLLVILAVIAIALAVSVVGIATLMIIEELSRAAPC